MTTLRRLVTASLVTCLFLIAVGATVRASGAGLGCPDWPFCFGQLIPPTSADQVPAAFDRSQFNVVHTWTEYINRLIGASFGLIVFATMVAAFLTGGVSRMVRSLLVVAVLLTGFVAWLGKIVVEEGLAPEWITGHLVPAVTIAALLAHVRLILSHPTRVAPTEPRRKSLLTLAWVAFGLSAIQFLMGAFVRAGIDGIKRATPEADGLPRAEWLSEVALDLPHRQFALIVFGVVAALWWQVRNQLAESERWGRRSADIAAASAGGQILVGLSLAYMGFPPVAMVLHLSLAAWLLVSLHTLQLSLARRPA